MSRNSKPFTTRRTVLGVPVGKPRTDWASVRKTAIAGAGVASAAAGGARVIRHGLPKVLLRLPGQVVGTATKAVAGTANMATGQLRKTTGQVAGGASNRLGQVASKSRSAGRSAGQRATRSRPARAASSGGSSNGTRRKAATTGRARAQKSTSKATKRSSSRT
jgi:hypothetical protein